MNLSEFDYALPPERIAQYPLEERGASRMLVLDRRVERWEDRHFRDLPQYLGPGDCLVLNDSKVIPSRLFGTRQGHSGIIQIFLTHPLSSDRGVWSALVRPGRKVRTGDVIHVARELRVEILSRGPYGERTVKLAATGDLDEVLDRVGHIPLPPYIHRPDEPPDRERYQTIYARARGSVAAPTAGLHFTPQVLDHCRGAGASIARVTLHVGLGTFQPLHAVEVEENHLHPEAYSVAPEHLETIRAAARRIAVGTTSVRTLETLWRAGPSGETGLFIYPGFEFRATGALLTNFHLPSTSLLLLVCAFAGKDFVLAAYRHAVEREYRFYSYGDCMLIV